MDREEHIHSVGDEEEYQEIHKLASERHLSIFELILVDKDFKMKDMRSNEEILIDSVNKSFFFFTINAKLTFLILKRRSGHIGDLFEQNNNQKRIEF